MSLTACGSASHRAVGCHVAHTCPSNRGSYGWRPLPGAPALLCGLNVNQSSFPEFVDYRHGFYLCKLPAPADPYTQAGADFLVQ